MIDSDRDSKLRSNCLIEWLSAFLNAIKNEFLDLKYVLWLRLRLWNSRENCSASYLSDIVKLEFFLLLNSVAQHHFWMLATRFLLNLTFIVFEISAFNKLKVKLHSSTWHQTLSYVDLSQFFLLSSVSFFEVLWSSRRHCFRKHLQLSVNHQILFKQNMPSFLRVHLKQLRNKLSWMIEMRRLRGRIFKNDADIILWSQSEKATSRSLHSVSTFVHSLQSDSRRREYSGLTIQIYWFSSQYEKKCAGENENSLSDSSKYCKYN